MQASVGVLENRVNGTGNSGAQVQTQGSDQITVTVPGKAATSVVNLIDTTAKLAFRPVLLFEPYTGVSTAPAKAKATGTPAPTPSGSASSTATPAASPTPSVSSTAERQREGVDLRRLRQARQPDRHPHRHGIGEGDDELDGQGDRVAHRHRHPERQPGCHRRRDHHLRRPVGGQRGHDEAVRRAGLQARPEPVHRGRQLEEHRPRLQRRRFPVGQPQDPDCLLRRVRQQVRARPGRGSRAHEISSVNAALDTSNDQWVVNITLNGAGTSAFGTLTTNQYSKYFSGYQGGNETRRRA